MNLTDRQREILEYMQSRAKVRIDYPGIREIAEHFEVWPSTIHDHIKALRKKGCLPTDTVHTLCIDSESPDRLITDQHRN